MKLNQLSLIFIGSLLLALGVNAWMLFDIQQQQHKMDLAHQQHIQSINLTARIENDIHQLSQFVRAYLSTGESIYLRYYYDLLDIRKGIKPEPEQYTELYWHEVIAEQRSHNFERDKGEKQSLIQKLIDLSFTLEEAKRFEKILAISDQMAQREQQAFTVKQELQHTKQGVWDSNTDQMAVAMNAINNPNYLQLNNELLYQVGMLTAITNERTQQQADKAKQQVYQAIHYAILTVLASIVLLFAMGYFISKRIVFPLNKIIEASNKLEQNQYDTRAHIGKSISELRHLARNFNEMAANIETDVWHRSQIEQELIGEKVKVEETHQQIQDSINYASLIQKALIPSEEAMNAFFKEQTHIWLPKDVVGGDIYLFTPLRNEEESLLMIIDCTGHGVPGAFLTMLIKAIHQQIITTLKHRQGEISPAKLLTEFNITLKHLLKQDKEQPQPQGRLAIQHHHDVGFDGAIIYCDKQRNLVRFAGAHTPLFYINGPELNVIKGDRQSIGYRNSKVDAVFTDHDVIATPYTIFYLTTDGYLDQNGGVKNLPFGKKRFHEVILQHYDIALNHQRDMFLTALHKHQLEEPQTDDITLLAFRL
jgi:serine phosphatase RsbU (regulator of sigma subunit)